MTAKLSRDARSWTLSELHLAAACSSALFSQAKEPLATHTMALPSKYQNGSIDAAVKGVYRASPVKLMIYGRGKATLFLGV
jgi:hypothetical protein